MTPQAKLAFLKGPAEEAAPLLLGCLLERVLDGERMVARIVETEAYDQSDAASHSFKGPTARTEVMFGPAGRLYVYFTYGMHYCCNVVVGRSGHGAAVLIRAVEPLIGAATMAERRAGRTGAQLTNGPAKVCQALGINKQLNGHDLRCHPLLLVPGELLPGEQMVQTKRIGLSIAQDVPWRFYIAGNPYVSRR